MSLTNLTFAQKVELLAGIALSAIGAPESIAATGAALGTAVPHPAYAALVDFRTRPNPAGVGGMFGDPTDLLGLGAEAHVEAANTAAWGTAGYFSTTAAAAFGGASIQQRKINFDLATDSIVFAFRIKAAAPAASGPIMGNGGAANNGVTISARTNGKVRVTIGASLTGSSAIVNDSTATVFDNLDHSMLVAIHRNGNIYTYIDGVLDSVYNGTFTGNTVNGTSNWRFGYAYVTSTSVAISLTDYFHFLRFRGAGLPLGLTPLAAKLAANPRAIVEAKDLKPVKKTIACFVGPGQSNEYGAGIQPTNSGPYAAPQRDPLPLIFGQRAGGQRGWWTTLAGMLGRRGVWADFYNGAVGSTSIAHSWVGILRQWTNGMLALTGTYVLNAGGVWKNTGPGSKTTPDVRASTVAPTGTTVGADAAAGADGIVWRYMGAARAQDVPGYIYPHTDTYFDPNGLFADIKTAMNLYPQGYDEKHAFFSLGQGDKSMGTLKDEFALAYRRGVEFYLANGVDVVWLGFTCASAAAVGAEPAYQNELIPGYEAALAFYAANPKVKRGSNLRVDIGPLEIAAEDKIGLFNQNPAVHMNDITLTLAAEKWRDAMVAADAV